MSFRCSKPHCSVSSRVCSRFWERRPALLTRSALPDKSTSRAPTLWLLRSTLLLLTPQEAGPSQIWRHEAQESCICASDSKCTPQPGQRPAQASCLLPFRKQWEENASCRWLHLRTPHGPHCSLPMPTGYPLCPPCSRPRGELFHQHLRTSACLCPDVRVQLSSAVPQIWI